MCILIVRDLPGVLNKFAALGGKLAEGDRRVSLGVLHRPVDLLVVGHTTNVLA